MRRSLLAVVASLFAIDALAVPPTVVTVWPVGTLPHGQNGSLAFYTSVFSDQDATCKYATSAGVAYDSMSAMSQRSAKHWIVGETTNDGVSRTRYFKCKNMTTGEISAEVSQAVTIGTPASYSGTPSGIFPAAKTSGTTLFKIHPTASGNGQRVAFGVPFPNGWLATAALGNVRILKAGVEQAISVSCMTPWRHAGTRSDTAYCRSLAVQMDIDFPTVAPVYFTVEWGTTGRNVGNDLTPVAVRDTWVSVSGDPHWLGGNAFTEPRGLAVFSPAWYAACIIREPFIPDYGSRSFRAYDNVMRNFIDTAINWTDPRVTNTILQRYWEQAIYESWLYDRPAWVIQAGLGRGDYRVLREGIRLASYYQGTVNTTTGISSVKDSADGKYSVNDGLFAAMLLTGDSGFTTQIEATATAWENVFGASQFNNVFYVAYTTTFWTERNAGFYLSNQSIAYEATGTTLYAKKAQWAMACSKWVQDNPYPSSPTSIGAVAFIDGGVSGGVIHEGAIHDSDWAGPGISPWQSAMLSEPAFRWYVHSNDTSVGPFIVALADFIANRTLVPWAGWRSGPRTHDYGIVPLYSYPLGGEGPDQEHCSDVASILALALHFDPSKATIKQKFWDLFNTHMYTGVPYWVRPNALAVGYTMYRNDPLRKAGWWMKPFFPASFALGYAEQHPGMIVVTPSASVAAMTPAGSITATYKVTNIGAENALNVNIIGDFGQYNNTGSLTVASCSGGTSCTNAFSNAEGLQQTSWLLGTIAPGATQTISAVLTFSTHATVPTQGRDMAPVLLLTTAKWCVSGDASCSAATGSDPGNYPRAVVQPSISVLRSDNTSYTDVHPTAPSGLSVAQ